MELMSPAGNYASFKAAINSVADAVYLGLNLFNARKPAKNFGFTELEDIVKEAHDNKTKVYITLNIDLKSNELTDAVKILVLLQKVKADAVIVKDPAVIYFMNKYFPDLELHLSTQFGIANSKAIRAAGMLLKAKRVVLARELTYNEIKALNNNTFPEREVFIQGSMCYSFSGRCLMSSWNGGRSANRGSCQAPCRFLYKKNDEKSAHSFFSMKDLSLADKISELKKLNVSALKIEGRLKSSGWVGEITSIYRNILDHNSEVDMSVLQKFSGRELSKGYYGGFNDLTSEQIVKAGQFSENKTSDKSVGKGKYDLHIKLLNNKINIDIISDYGNDQISASHKWIRKENRAIYITDLSEKLSETSFGGLFLGHLHLEDDFLVTKSQMKNLISEIGSKIAPLLNKERKFLKSIKINEEIESEIRSNNNNRSNKIPVEFKNAVTLRINSSDISDIKDSINSSVKKIIIDKADIKDLYIISELSKKINLEISLFPIQFETDIILLEKLIYELEKTDIKSYEINDIGHLELLKNTSKKINGGPFISPYNHIAAKYMSSLGMNSVHLPLEADIECINGLANSDTPLRFTIYTKVPLFYSRTINPEIKEEDTFSDIHGMKTIVKKYNDIQIFYSNEYFTSYGVDLKTFLVSELIINLSDEANIMNKFEQIRNNPENFEGNNFNLSRRLS